MIKHIFKLSLRITLILAFLQFSLPIWNCQAVFAQGAASSSEVESKIVKAIEVKGNKTISIATVLSKIKTRVGQPYIQSVISDDLKRLYNTGYFADVRVDREDFEGGFKVFIYLEEKPIIEEVTFSKTKYIKSRKMIKEMKTKKGKFLDRKTLQDDINLIKDMYIQKGLTTAEVDAETFVNDITNKASVHFIIKEGQRVRIKRINIEGNESFKDKQILKVMKTKAKWWFNSGILKDEVIEEDMERVMSFYEQEGFIDAVADYRVEYLPKGWINVHIDILEGQRYYVGDIAINGAEIVEPAEIKEVMAEIEEGGVFSRERLTVDISNIRTLYFEKGYIFANVLESTSLDPETGNVRVKIDIQEGGPAYIERVKIQGNIRTRDIVIRRELRMFPGDRFDGAKLRRSKERLQNLGYFEDIAFDIEDTDIQDRKNLIVEVKEAKTGTFSFGGGFSTVDQFIGFVEIEQRNFDFTNWPTFTGGGQRLSLRAETGSTRNNFRLSFTEPWIFDRPISFGFDLYALNRDREEDTGYAYDEERIGGQIRFGKQFGEYFSVGTSYKIEDVTISDLEQDVSGALMQEEGDNRLSVLGFTTTLDKRDSTINPTKGFVWNNGFDLAGGLLGGDRDFYRMQTRGSYYIPLQWESVLEFRARTGWVDAYDDSDNVPIFERFFAGGARSIRGYEERKVGPLDSSTTDPVGGEAMFVANVEYTIPLFDYIKFATFFDTGQVWSTVQDFGSGGLKSGAGVGLRIKTPIGPVNLDYGYPLNDEPGEESRSGKFYFSVSRGF